MISKRKICTILILLACLFAINAFAENSPPVRSIITHAQGESKPGEEVLFTTWYIDPDGWQDLKYARFIISPEIRYENCFYGEYRLSNNSMSIMNDEGTEWIGSFPAGSQNVIENSYVKLNCAKSTISGAENILRVTWAITFKEPFAGKTYNTYLYAKDILDARTPWNQEGTWKVKAVTPPRTLRFQGMLKDTEGIPIRDSLTLKLKLYEEDIDGPEIWQEVQQDVEIEDGLLDIELGSRSPLNNLPFDKQYWLGIAVGNDLEMSPRFKLTSAPYAFQADE